MNITLYKFLAQFLVKKIFLTSAGVFIFSRENGVQQRDNYSKILTTTDGPTIPCETVLLTNHKNAMPITPNKTRTSMQVPGKPSEHAHDLVSPPLGGDC